MSMQQALAAAAAKAQADELRKRLDAQKDLAAQQYKDATAYANLIVGAGYAAFFTVWAFTRSYLTPKQVLWSALLMLISLVFFVVFEIYKTFMQAVMANDMDKLTRGGVGDAELFRIVRDYESKIRKRAAEAWYAWVVSFAVSVITGLTAAGILIYAVGASLSWEYH